MSMVSYCLFFHFSLREWPLGRDRVNELRPFSYKNFNILKYDVVKRQFYSKPFCQACRCAMASIQYALSCMGCSLKYAAVQSKYYWSSLIFAYQLVHMTPSALPICHCCFRYSAKQTIEKNSHQACVLIKIFFFYFFAEWSHSCFCRGFLLRLWHSWILQGLSF